MDEFDSSSMLGLPTVPAAQMSAGTEQLIREQIAKQEAANAIKRKNLEDMLRAQLANQKSSVNLAPAATFADSLAGTHIAPGVASQQAEATANANKADELFKELNAPGKDGLPMSSLLGAANASKRNAIGQERLARQDSAQRLKALGAIDSNEVIKGYKKTLGYFSRGQHLIDDPSVKLDWSRLNGLMQEIESGIAGGTATEGQIVRTNTDPIVKILAKYKDKLGNTVTDLRNEPEAAEMLQSIRSTLASLNQSVGVQYQNERNNVENTANAAGIVGIGKAVEQKAKADKLPGGQGVRDALGEAPVAAQPTAAATDPRARLEELRKKAAGG